MHIGNRIKEVFESLPKSNDIDWFAAQIPCTRRHLYRIFHKENIDIQLLQRISTILDHDFFHELSDDAERGNGSDKQLGLN